MKYNLMGVVKDKNTVVGLLVLITNKLGEMSYQVLNLNQVHEVINDRKLKGVEFTSDGDVKFINKSSQLINFLLTPFKNNKSLFGVAYNMNNSLTPYKMANITRFKKEHIIEVENNNKLAVCVTSISNINNEIIAYIRVYGDNVLIEKFINDINTLEIHSLEPIKEHPFNGVDMVPVYLYDLLEYQLNSNLFNISLGGYLDWFSDSFSNHDDYVIKLTDEQMDYVVGLIEENNKKIK